MKGGLPKNWVAIRYETAIAMEKAIASGPFTITGGCICGVQRLPESQKFFQSQQQLTASISNDTTGRGGVFSPGNPRTADNSNKAGSDEDIYVPRSDEVGNATRKNMCERFMGWIYGW